MEADKISVKDFMTEHIHQKTYFTELIAVKISAAYMVMTDNG